VGHPPHRQALERDPGGRRLNMNQRYRVELDPRTIRVTANRWRAAEHYRAGHAVLNECGPGFRM
jgi:hypothetical protein